MSTLTLNNIQHIDRTLYPDTEIVGSDRFYYNKYPYKAALIDNQIRYDVSRALEIYDWLETVGREDTKFKSGHTRHVYFKDIDKLYFFIDMFADQIDKVQGPVSNKHIAYLFERKHNGERHNPNFREELIIRKTKWHNTYDCKVWIGTKLKYNNFMGIINSDYSKAVRTIRQDTIRTIENMVDKSRKHRWNFIYCDSKYAEDIHFYVKLKHPDAFIVITKALVEEKL